MRNIRISILIALILLLAIGTVMIYSASGVYAYEKFGDSAFFLKRHLIFLCIGALLGFAMLAIDYHALKKYSKPILAISLILLVAVLIPYFGEQISGARRWFRFWKFLFQPAELAKLGLVIYLAEVLSRKGPFVNNFKFGFMPPFAASCLTAGLVLIQPDLGTAITIGCIAFLLFFIAGVSWKYLAGVFLVSLPVIFVSVLMAPYRLRRILVFLDPWKDPRGSGFQIIQSFLALVSGGVFGLGLGMSKQKLLYLPASHTDFIFSIIGEELGFLGAASVVVLFAVLVWQGIRVALKAKDSFGRLLAFGISSLIAIEAFINISVTTGALPTKGLPLPFISYGGSALIFHILGIGLLLNIAKDK